MTPDQYTIKEFFVDVGNGHQLYVQEWGNKKAEPIIFLHGGPGGSCSNGHRMAFDPKIHRVIFFDQRGSGNSLPLGSLEHNTTADLVEDIEKIATHLKLKQFVLKGGSWGSTLALAYGLKYPKRVKAMVLQGVWTGSRVESDWLSKGGYRAFFPEVWERYVAGVPKNHQADPSKYYFKRIVSKDSKAAREAAGAFLNMERALVQLDDRFTPVDSSDPAFDPGGARIEINYIMNDCFMPDRHILNNAGKLAMPIWIVQGRYDMLCPPYTAIELSRKLPNSRVLMAIGGHRSGEREAESLVRTILLQFGVKS